MDEEEIDADCDIFVEIEDDGRDWAWNVGRDALVFAVGAFAFEESRIRSVNLEGTPRVVDGDGVVVELPVGND